MHSPRAQADKKLYQFTMKHRVEAQPNLTLRQEWSKVCWFEECADSGSLGARSRGDSASWRAATRCYRAKAVVLTTGTFLKADHAHRRSEDARRPGRRRVRRSAERQPRRLRLRAGPLQDRHAVPAQRPDHRLRKVRSRSPATTTRGRSASPPRGSRSRRSIATSPTPTRRSTTHPREPAPGADVLGPDPQPRAALLPVDRGQGGPLRRQGSAPDLPRTGRAATPASTTATASAPACPRTCSRRCCGSSPAWRTPR